MCFVWKRKDSGREMAVCADCSTSIYLDEFMKCFGLYAPKWNNLTDEEKRCIAIAECRLLSSGDDSYEE